jgi:hypothetical protein
MRSWVHHQQDTTDTRRIASCAMNGPAAIDFCISDNKIKLEHVS